MQIHVDAIVARLTGLGWTIRQVVAPALTVEDRTLDVVSVLARCGMLHGHIVVLLASEDGDMADRYACLAQPSIAIVSRRLPGCNWKLRAEVRDHARARDELECLRAALRGSGFSFQDACSLFEQRGWHIDGGGSEETFFDPPGWLIEGVQGSDLLSIGTVWSGGGSDDASIDVDWSSAHIRTRHYFASVSVTSRALAEELVEAF